MRTVGRQSAKHSLAPLGTASRKRWHANMGTLRHADGHENAAVCISAGQGNNANMMSSNSGRAGLLRAQAPGVAAGQVASTVRHRQRAVANHPQGQEKQSIQLIAGNFHRGLRRCSIRWLWPASSSQSHSAARGKALPDALLCHPVAPATRRFTSRSPLGRRLRNSRARARSGATAARRTNRSRWSPSAPSSSALQPLTVHLRESETPAWLRNGWRNFSMKSSRGKKNCIVYVVYTTGSLHEANAGMRTRLHNQVAAVYHRIPAITRSSSHLAAMPRER